MKFWRGRKVQMFAALFAFAIFGGYLVADAIADAGHGCASESSQHSPNDDDCALCLTCCHGASLFQFAAALAGSPMLLGYRSVPPRDESAFDGPPARIDHPPQLA